MSVFLTDLSILQTVGYFDRFLASSMSSPHYCIWGLCKSQQHCCGDNVCCDEITGIDTLIVTGIIFGTMFIISICCIGYYFIYRRVYASYLKKYAKMTYTLMSNQRKKETNAARNQDTIVEDCVVQVEKTKTML